MKQSLTVRLAAQARKRLECDAAARGVSLSDAIEELILGKPARASSATAVTMRPLAEIGHRIALAIDVLPDDAVATRGHLVAMKRLVAQTLVSATPDFDAEIQQSTGKHDKWTG